MVNERHVKKHLFSSKILSSNTVVYCDPCMESLWIILLITMEQLIFITFCYKFGETETDSYTVLVQEYAAYTTGKIVFLNSLKNFKDGIQSVGNVPHSGRQSTNTIHYNVIRFCLSRFFFFLRRFNPFRHEDFW